MSPVVETAGGAVLADGDGFLTEGVTFRWGPSRLIDLVIAGRPELPREWAMMRRDETTAWWYYHRRKLRVTELLARAPSGELWHHVLVSHPTRAVRLDEIQLVRRLFIGAEREALLVLDPALEERGLARLASCRGQHNPLVPPVVIVSGGAPAPAASVGGPRP